MKNKAAKNIRWGILGPGEIAHKFAQDLAKVENTSLVAVASRSQEKASDFAKQYSVEIAYNSYEALAKDPQIDAIYIATPHSFHKEHAILCLQNKKAVLCEKPFAMNLQEVTQMIEVAKEHNVLLMEALWTYFLPHYQYVLALIKSERFGKVKTLEADFGFYTPYNLDSRLFKKEVGGGSLLDIGIYPIFVALSSLGTPVKIAAKATFFENGADASCKITFDYKDAKAVLKSTLLEVTASEAIFTCEKGSIKINRKFHAPSSVTIIEDGQEETLNFHTDSIGYNFEIEHFNQLLREHKTESDVMTFEFSKNLIETLDTVRAVIGLVY
jgi:predicted dehydrogenase